MPGRVPDFGPLTKGPGPTSSSGSLAAPRVACRCSPAGFDRQHVVHIAIGDRTCRIPYLCCTLLACEVGLADTEGSYSSCTQVRFLG
jgi:hypothetical protein